MFSENSAFPLQFPLILEEPLLLYQEQSEGNGRWSQVKYLEIQIPSKWDMSGEIVDHRSFFIFNYDIFSQVDRAQSQGLLRDSFQSGDKLNTSIPAQDTNSLSSRYKLISQKQKALFATTDFNDRSEILLTYSTDLHYCSTIAYLSKKPYEISTPAGVRAKDYQFIFFKRKTEKDELLIDVVGFRKKEKRLDLILAFLMKQLVYEVRYSKEGIKKQVEDAVERIFMQVLKHVFRFISKAMLITQYKKMIELTYYVLVRQRQEFQRLFYLKDSSPLFCENIRILKRDISSIVYKVMITEGLFPINCEINTMDDSYIKLKLLSMIADSEILPWSPKFHASLALGNFHYSFTPNDLFNLRTLKTRKYNKNYQYVSMKVLDFFPLDHWVDMISEFFQENLCTILQYIGEYMDTEDRQRQFNRDNDDKTEKVRNTKSGLREPFIKVINIDPYIERSSSSFLGQKQFPIETELISDQVQSSQSKNMGTMQQSNQSLYLSADFKPRDIIFRETSLFETAIDSKDQQALHKKQLLHFKSILKRSLKRVTFQTKMYDMIIETPLIQRIKTQIADEFHSTYRYELEVSGILTQFCQIITETELRSYSTFVNNCQTPVAAFIYMLCDTFRPYSESLDPQINFLNQCRANGYKCGQVAHKESKQKTRDLSDLQQIWGDQEKSQDVEPQNLGPIKSRPVFSYISQEQYHLEFESQLSQYLKYSASFNLLLMGQRFIQPAVLDKALDYFGFYGDNFSAQYLKKMQNIDADLNSFTDPQLRQKKRFRQNNDTVFIPYEHEQQFSSLINQYDSQFFMNYEHIMDSYQKSNEQTTVEDVSSLIKTVQQPSIVEVQQQEQDQSHIDRLDMHYLLIHYQNKLIQLRQDDVKNASQKHHYQQLYQEACFIYYNSIRLQLTQKVRKNTLSYIGFLLAKDLDQVSPMVPENVTLQTLV